MNMSDQLERLSTKLKSEFNSLAGWWLEHVVNIEAGSVAGEVSNGGLIWSVDADHQPHSCKKQSYGQAFAVCGLSEYSMAFRSHAALEWANRLVDLLEQHDTCDHGGVFNNWTADGFRDNLPIWWVQAEAMVGFFNAWAFTRAHQCDHEHGEWLWLSKLDPPAEPIYKAGQWKAPNHNGRALLEMIFRLETKGQALPEYLF